MSAQPIFDLYRESYDSHQQEVMSLMEYLEACRDDQSMYASAYERLLLAIGKAKMVDTHQDPRLGRIFHNRVIRTYPAFGEFYGMENVIENIVSFLTRAAQGLEEAKQILYLLGPVGGGKSSLANRLKELMEQEPFYVLKIKDSVYSEKDENCPSIISPVFESPLGLFSPQFQRKMLTEEYGINPIGIPSVMSPWAAKRLREQDGDLAKFEVVRMFPSELEQVSIAVTDPADENNQDVSSLVGNLDINKVELFSQSDPDAYSFSGGLCLANQGILEFREMFKAPIKTLNPLLFATQDGNYKATEGISALPFNGLVLAHSNESEWEQFRTNTRNEAFIDRVNIVKVPYCLRVSDEMRIYEKLIRHSALNKEPCAPWTLRLLAEFSVLTRLGDPGEKSTWRSKMCVYDGESVKEKDPSAKALQEYQDNAGVNEGMSGISTRFAFKVLSQTYNYDPEETGANPIHLMHILEHELKHLLPGDQEKLKLYFGQFIKGTILPEFKEFIENEIRQAYFESYGEYGQNMFDRYIAYTEHWIEDEDYRDPATNEMWDRDELNEELKKIEVPSEIRNSKDFRNEVLRYVLKYRTQHDGKNPDWTSYQKLREVIEKKMFMNTEDLLPVIRFDGKATDEMQKKHNNFVARMVEKRYTERMVRLVVDWHLRVHKHS